MDSINLKVLNTNNLSINYNYEVVDQPDIIHIKEIKINEQIIFFGLLLLLYLAKNYHLSYQFFQPPSVATYNLTEEAGIAGYLNDWQITSVDGSNNAKEFLEHKQLLTSKYLIEKGVSSTCFLDQDQLEALHTSIAQEFKIIANSNHELANNQLKLNFLYGKAEQDNLIKIALAIQNKYHIPVSVLLAQAIIQSNWGNSVFEKNLFNVIEEDDLKTYNSYEDAFEEFANSLISDNKFSSLFTGGKDYKSWTAKLGEISCNENIFSLEKECINKMEVLIHDLQLDLLDY